jgi:hypothetical protein
LKHFIFLDFPPIYTDAKRSKRWNFKMINLLQAQSLKAVFPTLCLLSVLSCTRLTKESTSTVTLEMAKTLQVPGAVSAQTATLVAQHIVVNITGSDMETAYQILDANRANGASKCDPNNSAPGTSSLEVPQGSGRLIQVLVAYCDSSSQGGNMTIYYGSVTKDLKGAEVTVDVPVKPINGAIAGDGSIMGRYLTDSNTGPTGLVKVMYKAPAEPAMLVEQTEIFGGWFRFFALQSGGFDYILEDGTPLFINAATSATYPAPEVGVLNLPIGYKNQNSGGGTPNYQAEEAQQVVVGFFGPGSAGKKMCSHVSGSMIPNFYTDITATTQVSWSGSTPSDTAGYISGGDPSPSCNVSGDIYQDFISTSISTIANRDSAFGFKGLFKLTGGNGNAVQGTQGTTSVSLNWSYMPGAMNGVDGSEIFYKWISANTDDKLAPYYNDNGVDCDGLVSFGFIDYGAAPAADGANLVTTTVTVGANPGANLLPKIFVCPYRLNAPGRPGQKTYFRTAGEWRGGAFPLVMQVSNTMTVAGMTSNIAVDSAGNVYYPNINGYKIMKIDPAGNETIFAGSGSNSILDGVGAAAGFGAPYFVTIDSSNNLYVADSNTIRKITPAQVVSTVTTMPDGGSPRGIAADNSGNVYFVWDNYSTTTHVVLKINSGGTITTLAGSSTAGDANGTSAVARFNFPNDLVVDSGGNVFVADAGNHKIKKITPAGVVTTFAGNGVQGMADGNGVSASFYFALSSGTYYSRMAIDSANNIYVGDMDSAYPNSHNLIRRISPTGVVSTFCGGVGATMGLGSCSQVTLYSRFGVAVGLDGTVYFADGSLLSKIVQ